MNTKHHSMAGALTYAGTLLLVTTSGGLMLGLISPAGAVHIATIYSAIIISFIAGIHWACFLFFSERCPRNLLLASNIVALLAWLSLLADETPWQILLQILCFLYLLALDFMLKKAAILPTWFYRLRCHATLIVVLSLSIMLVHGWNGG